MSRVSDTSVASPERINAFWLGDAVDGPEQALARREVWYRGGKALDDEIASSFGPSIDAALLGTLDGWAESSEGALALVILLDQFTRNVFRNTPKAYAGDPKAREAAQECVRAERHRELSVAGRIFLYHPYHHSEDIGLQNKGVQLVEGIADDVAEEWHPYVARSVGGFGRHRDIVAQFGRFPHRNTCFNRTSTTEEQAFMDAGAENFGQSGSAKTSG
jgi:uncharacterized protein (DUF924 family)